MSVPNVVIRHLGTTDYETTWRAMQAFSTSREADTLDELWLTEHAAVYTLGLNRKNVRLPAISHDDIPMVLTDRGGKITYHGLGQIIIYFLLDLKRRQLNIRQLVTLIETSIIDLLATNHIEAIARKDAPGVYVAGQKIASLGLRLKNNVCYHGLSLNVKMDLTPFLAIDPCGYEGLQMTQTSQLGMQQTPQQVGATLITNLAAKLNVWKLINERNCK